MNALWISGLISVGALASLTGAGLAYEAIDLEEAEARIDRIMDADSMSESQAREVIRLTTFLIKDDPEHYNAYYRRSYAKDEIGDYTGALEDINADIMVSPTHHSYNLRGIIKYNSDNLGGACRDWHEGMKLGSDNSRENFNDSCEDFVDVAVKEETPSSFRESAWGDQNNESAAINEVRQDVQNLRNDMQRRQRNQVITNTLQSVSNTLRRQQQMRMENQRRMAEQQRRFAENQRRQMEMNRIRMQQSQMRLNQMRNGSMYRPYGF
jgi:tetratricopeptide (TPR) repeat protein